MATLGAREVAAVCAVGCKRPDHDECPARGRGGSLDLPVFFRCSFRERVMRLLHVLVENDLASTTGTDVPTSGRFSPGVADRGFSNRSIRDNCIGLPLPATAISARGLALVSRNTSPGNRIGAGRGCSDGGSLCLHSVGGNFHCDCFWCGRLGGGEEG